VVIGVVAATIFFFLPHQERFFCIIQFFVETTRSASSVNLPAMANRQQMHLVPCDLNRVNDSIVADAQTETIAASKPIMWESRQA
jgi:hypothetical protein